MVEPNRIPRTCPNGHITPHNDAAFCITCGLRLVVFIEQQTIPPQGSPSSFSPQTSSTHNPNQMQKPQMPVNRMPPGNGYAQPAYPAYGQMQPMPMSGFVQEQCHVCGGQGQRLDPKKIICEQCNWLRPLANGYAMDCSAFQYSEDGKAMAVLRSIGPLNAAAKAISDKVGRRWVETTFNGVLLGEKQLPDIYFQAVRAARIMGMTHMPDVYISGERSWDCLTYGSDKNAFIVIGTALATSFQGPEMLFLLAREMGHCRAGHALWKTVIRFLLGEQGPRKGLMAGGLLSALSPTALLEGAMEMPLLAWARQAEITADRAGLLAVGNEEIARKVLLSWSLKSPVLYRHINITSWLEQQADSGDDMTKLSELTTSSTPYISRRLSLLTQFAQTPALKQWQTVIARYAGPIKRPAPPAPPPANATGKAVTTATKPGVITAPTVPTTSTSPASNDLRVACAACKTPMRIPAQVISGKEKVSVKCPNVKCGKVIALKKSVRPSTPVKPATPTTLTEPATQPPTNQTPKLSSERILDNDTE